MDPRADLAGPRPRGRHVRRLAGRSCQESSKATGSPAIRDPAFLMEPPGARTNPCGRSVHGIEARCAAYQELQRISMPPCDRRRRAPLSWDAGGSSPAQQRHPRCQT